MGLFWAFFFGALCYTAYSGGKKLSEWQDNNRAPLISVSARIVKKEKRCDTAMVSTGDGAMMPVGNTIYEMTFRTETGEEKKYSVSRKIYTNAERGDVGILRSKGTRFIAFDPK